jgi:SAM-dependent methyltransferase
MSSLDPNVVPHRRRFHASSRLGWHFFVMARGLRQSQDGAMAIYRDVVFPHVINLAMNTKTTREIRDRVCSRLKGEVVEIGFGTGLNVPHLPAGVTRLHAVDPMRTGARLASKRVAASPVPVSLAGLDGESLPFADQSADAVLSTWTLCSIPDAVAALREVRRVLRPGGALHFVEHGRSPDEGVRRWQDRLNPVEQRVACGCNLNRDIPGLVEQAGLRVERLDTYYTPGDPKVLGWTYEGVAVPA